MRKKFTVLMLLLFIASPASAFLTEDEQKESFAPVRSTFRLGIELQLKRLVYSNTTFKQLVAQEGIKHAFVQFDHAIRKVFRDMINNQKILSSHVTSIFSPTLSPEFPGTEASFSLTSKIIYPSNASKKMVKLTSFTGIFPLLDERLKLPSKNIHEGKTYYVDDISWTIPVLSNLFVRPIEWDQLSEDRFMSLFGHLCQYNKSIYTDLKNLHQKKEILFLLEFYEKKDGKEIIQGLLCSIENAQNPQGQYCFCFYDTPGRGQQMYLYFVRTIFPLLRTQGKTQHFISKNNPEIENFHRRYMQ